MSRRVKRISLCPYLRGNVEGVMCSAADKLIKHIEDASIRLCMSRQYEVCTVYRLKLQDCYRASLPFPAIEAGQ